MYNITLKFEKNSDLITFYWEQQWGQFWSPLYLLTTPLHSHMLWVAVTEHRFI